MPPCDAMMPRARCHCAAAYFRLMVLIRHDADAADAAPLILFSFAMPPLFSPCHAILMPPLRRHYYFTRRAVFRMPLSLMPLSFH